MAQRKNKKTGKNLVDVIKSPQQPLSPEQIKLKKEEITGRARNESFYNNMFPMDKFASSEQIGIELQSEMNQFQSELQSNIRRNNVNNFERQQVNNTPLMLNSSDPPITMDEWEANRQAEKRSNRRTEAQAKLDNAAAGTGTSPEITSSHIAKQEKSINRRQMAQEKLNTAAEGYGHDPSIARSHLGMQRNDPKVAHSAEVAKRVDDLLIGEGLDEDYIRELTNREITNERKILDYSADTGRTVKELHAADTGGTINHNKSLQTSSGSAIGVSQGTGRLENKTPITGQNGTYLDTVEKEVGFDERLRRLDSRKGTNYYDNLKAQDLDLDGALTIEQYRSNRNIDIPSETKVYKKAMNSSGTNSVASTTTKAAKETTEQLTNTTGKVVGKNADDVAKQVSKFGKAGRIVAGLGVGAMVISNMNKNKGQQTNGQLYGQQTPYGY